jgi:signal transduction histidine kinase
VTFSSLVDAKTLQRWLGDLVLAGLLLAFGLAVTRLAALNQPGSTPLDSLSYALIVAASVSLAVRRRWPVATLATAAAATSVYLLFGYPYGPIMVAFSIAAYTIAVTLPIRPAAITSGAALVAVTLHVFVPPDGDPGLAGLGPAAAWVVLPFAVGVTVRLTREAIAQEVHDVVGHGLAAINMQAEIALHLLHRKPEQAETALTAISHTSKQGLDELRATLAAVRRGGDRTPMPGLSQLPALRERLAHAGQPVTLSIDGEPAAALPGAVDLAAYRIVQEALTNVLRHAGSTTAEVRIVYGMEGLDIEVTDAGVGGVPVPGGSGIAGMRERVTALGGDLEAGPKPGGGFRVHAVLPLPDGAAS